MLSMFGIRKELNMVNEKELTLKEIEVASAFDVLLLALCTTKEQEQQVLRIIQKRKQKEKLCVQSVTKDT